MRSAPSYSKGSTTGLAQAVVEFPQPGNTIAAAKSIANIWASETELPHAPVAHIAYQPLPLLNKCCILAPCTRQGLQTWKCIKPAALVMEAAVLLWRPALPAQVQQHADAANMQAFEQRQCFCQRCIPCCYRHGRRQQGSPLAVRAGAKPGTQLLVTNPTSGLAPSSPHEGRESVQRSSRGPLLSTLAGKGNREAC